MKVNKVIILVIVFCMIFTTLAPLVNISYATSSTDTEKKLEFTTQEKTLAIGKSIKCTPSKKGISSKSVMSWSSSNPSVAIVDEKGKVTSVSRGETVITATVDGVSASYNLTVIPGKTEIFYANNNAKVQGNVILSIGDEENFVLQDELLSIDDSEVNWTSSKENVCTVDQSGMVKAIANGNSTITATLKSNEKIKKTIRVNVATPVSDIVLEDDQVLTYVGEKAQIEYKVLPDDAANTKIKYEVENKEVCTVNTKGVVTGKEDGITSVKMTSISNPEISQIVTVEVREEREYKSVSTSEIIPENIYVQNDDANRIGLNDKVSFENEYGKDASYINNNPDIIDLSFDTNQYTVTGKKDGLATITVNYSGMTSTIKILVGNYIDKSVLVTQNNKNTNNQNYNKETSIQKMKAIQDPEDETKTIDYVKDYPLEVGVNTNFEIMVSPITASTGDLSMELSNNKDFRLNNDGTVTALSPNKTANLVITSKSNPNAKLTLKIKSSIGNVKEVRFAKDYVGDNAFDINKYKEYSFNPIFVMESGKTYDPVADESIIEDEVYKALKKNVKITCEDEDVVSISSNKLKLKKGVNGTGILKIEYDKKKNARGTEESSDIVNYANFEAVGKVIETIKSIKFVQKEYEMAPGSAIAFNPIFKLSEGTTLDPTEDGVVESEDYQHFLSQIGLEEVGESGNYLKSSALLNFRYNEDGTTNNVIDPVYEGKCKIRMIVNDNPNIKAETIIQIKSPYVLQNQEEGAKVTKEIKATRYVNADSLTISKDVNGNGEVTSIPRSTAIYTFEKYNNGYSRVAYNGNENLYVESKYLAEKVEQTVKKVPKTTSSSSSSSGGSSSSSSSSGGSSSSSSSSGGSSSSSSSSGGSSSSSSSSGGSSSSSSSSSRGTVTKINADRYVVLNSGSLNVRSGPSTSNSSIGSLTNGSKVYVIDKDSNNWAKIKYNNGEGYVSCQYLATSPKKTTSKGTTNALGKPVSSSTTVLSSGQKVNKTRYTKVNCQIYSKKNTSRENLIRGVNKDTAVYVTTKYDDGWCYVTSPVKGYIKTFNLSELPSSNYLSNYKNRNKPNW